MSKKKKKFNLTFADFDLPLYAGSTENFGSLCDAFGGIADVEDPHAMATFRTGGNKPSAPVASDRARSADFTGSSPYPKRTNAASEQALMMHILDTCPCGVYCGSAYVKMEGFYLPATAHNIGKLLLATAPAEMAEAMTVRHFDAVATRLSLYLDNQKRFLQIPRYTVLFENGAWDALSWEPVDPGNDYLFNFQICAEFHPDEEAETPFFDKFLSTVSNEDPQISQRILEFLGYMLLPGAPAKNFFVLGLAPDSGKSQLAKFVQRLLGEDLACSVAIQDFGNDFVAAQIRGAAANLAMDVPNAALSPKTVAMLKMLTGHDRVTINGKYALPVPYQSLAKLVFATNDAIKLKIHDAAFFERMIIVPFPHSVPKHRQNRNLIEDLWEERHGIIPKIMSALRILLLQDLQFSPCQIAEQMKENWQQSAPSSVDDFVNDFCCFESTARTGSRVLFEAYRQYCARFGLPCKTETAFVRALQRDYSLSSVRWSEKGQQQRGLAGIKLLDQTPPASCDSDI